MHSAAKVQRARHDIVRICEEGLDWVDLSSAVSRVLRPLLGYDGACWHTMDPGTLLLTGNVIEDLPEGGLPILAACEYGAEDVNKWSYLARQAQPASRLTEATQGQPALSNRFRTLLHPAGLDRELRVSFVDRGGCWGAAGFYRGPGDPDFTEEDEAFLDSVARSIGLGYRRSLVLDLLEEDHSGEGPGLVVLDAGNAIGVQSAAAERWLAQLPRETPQDAGLPLSVLAVAERVRALRRTTDAAEVAASARVQTPGGEWLLIRATPLQGDEDGQIGIVVEPAGPPEIAQLMMAGYGFSEREQEVAYAVLSGAATKEIAEQLVISPHTVQDHLKAIFRKAEVRSRRELVSRIYTEHYLPQVAAGRSPTPDGWFGAGTKPTSVVG